MMDFLTYLRMMERHAGMLTGGELVATLIAVWRWIELADGGHVEMRLANAPPGEEMLTRLVSKETLYHRAEALGNEISRRLSRDTERLVRDLAKRTARTERQCSDFGEFPSRVRALENQMSANVRSITSAFARVGLLDGKVSELAEAARKVDEIIAGEVDEERKEMEALKPRFDSLVATVGGLDVQAGSTLAAVNAQGDDTNALRLRVESLERIVRGRFPEASHL